MTVVLAEIDENALERTRAEISGSGGHAVPAVVDVRDATALDRLAARVEDEFGPTRLLVNNAGVEQFGYLWDTPVSNWERLVSINISGVFHGIRAFLPRMLKQTEPGWVLNLSSVGGVTAVPLQAPYIMSKHAVLAMSECLHQEVQLAGARHIHVGAVLPGAVVSRIFDSAGGVDSGDLDAVEQVREAMFKVRDKAINADDAAAAILRQAADGEFYIVTQPATVLGVMRDRAEQLRNRRAPRLPEGSRF
ncbi:D-beta-hydroxybutyrate dehydrogenase [Amycolatopsis sp. YIM 10]|nr:D-beta-hydroxybutyrate dehydrogenase [Amycolatopsis sp. YIM 10]